MPVFRDALTKEGAHTRSPVHVQQQRPLKESAVRGGRGLTRRTPRGGRVCARLCVDRGVNKRYTNVSHLGVYPPPLLSPYPPSSLSLSYFLSPSFRTLPPPLFLSSTSSRSCRSRRPGRRSRFLDELLRRYGCGKRECEVVVWRAMHVVG